jgi:hypothetical protein
MESSEKMKTAGGGGYNTSLYTRKEKKKEQATSFIEKPLARQPEPSDSTGRTA